MVEKQFHKIGRTLEILLIEDSKDDAGLTIEALKGTSLHYHLNVSLDGMDALEFLHKKGNYADAARPDLILLDLNLPRRRGLEVLAEIKGDKNLRRIPVIVMTTSESEEDVFQAYDLHANCYISKPLDLHKLIKVARTIEDWLTVVELSKK